MGRKHHSHDDARALGYVNVQEATPSPRGGEGALLMPGLKDEILMSRRVLKFPVILSSNDFV